MKKKTVLITGASRGIGKAIALESARCGYNLIITCRKSIKELEQVVDECNELDITCISFVGDMGKSQDVSSLMAKLKKDNIKVDILVNNVGISHVGLLSDMSDEEWDNVISTNLSSLFYASRGVIPDMVNSKEGKILNISSIWGNVGASCEVAYSASKGGVNAFTKALAKELGPSNIQVNALALGVIDTEMNNCFTEDDKKILEDEIPVGRMGQPGEIAKIVVEMMNGKEYLTGQVITIDGGLT